jgi:hypothetical protein
MIQRHLVALVLTAAVLASGCTIRTRDDKNDLNGAANANAAAVQAPPAVAAPVATVAPVAAPPAPVAAPVAAPVVAAPKPAAPAVTTVIVQAAPTANPVQVCRDRFTRECTISCNDRVNQTVLPSKRRVAHDICFGECTRAAFSRCR